ncbi:MAG: HutD/Ves family protein [Acidimicrobiales bacterium]
MTPRVLRHADRVPTPWANGGGLTREVARSGAAGAGATDGRSHLDGPGFDWRVSVADVDRPGPFSRLPGVDRVIVLLDGTGLILSVDGREQVLERLVPFAFSGDAATTCELRNGPTRDFNVMTARGRVSATVEVHRVAGRREVSADDKGEELLVLAATEGLVARDPPAATELARLDAVAGPAVAVEGEGTVLVVHLRPLQ